MCRRAHRCHKCHRAQLPWLQHPELQELRQGGSWVHEALSSPRHPPLQVPARGLVAAGGSWGSHNRHQGLTPGSLLVFGGTAVPATPAITTTPTVPAIPTLQPFFRSCKISHFGTKLHPCCMGWGHPCPHQAPDGWQQPWHPALPRSHPMSLLSPGLGQRHRGPRHHRLLHPRSALMGSPAPSAPSGAAQGLPALAGIRVRTLRQVSLANRPAPPPPHTATCLPLSTLLGHPCRLPACPRPLNELKK